MSSSHINPNQLGGIPPLPGRAPATPSAGGFRDVLGEYSRTHEFDVKFSSHATTRLESKGIELSSTDHRRLMNGMSSLKAKGVRDGLVVVEDKRFVVSVANMTVITVMTSRDRDVYTNIQGVAFE